MIKVYVYVVGLALYQLTDGTSPAARILFPAGGFHSDILGADIAGHDLSATIQVPGKADEVVTQDLPTSFRLQAACPAGNCGPIVMPVNVPNLDEITGLRTRVRSEFLTAAGRKAARSVLAGWVELAGGWRMDAALSCADPKKTLPAPGEFSMKLNFIEARSPWVGLYENAEDLPAYGNAVRLEASVNSVADLTEDATLAKLLESARLSADVCRKRTGLSSPSGCLIVVLENGSGHETEEGHVQGVGGDLLGRADAHFAAIYHLLEQYPRQVYLPVVAEGRLCQKYDGAGTPGSQCVGGVMRDKAQ